MAENGLLGIVPTVIGAGLLVYATKYLLSDDKKTKKAKNMRLLDKI
jgi:hypothetical protein